MEFAASVVAIVEVSVNITVWCVQYAKDVRHADEETANLCREIGGLQTVLVRLQTSSTPSELLLSLKPVLDTCLTDLKDLTAKLKPSQGGRRTKQILIWPFLKRGELVPWIDRLERHKNLLTAAVTVDLLEMNGRIERHMEAMKDKVIQNHDETMGGVEEIRKLLEKMRKRGEDEALSERRKAVLKWLAVVDYQSNFTNNLSLCEPGTGKWFIESISCCQWLQPSSDTRRNLWLSGQAGSGKTVLMASVLKVALKSAANEVIHIPGSPKACILYFFFDFKDESKRMSRNMLLSILHQQVTYIAEVSESLLELSMKGPTQESATNEDLIDEIVGNFARFESTRFVIDALDECQDVGDALSFLQRLDEQTLAGANLLTLVSSRDEVQIQHGFRRTTFEKLPVSQASIDEDIKIHIENCLVQDDQQRFARFSNAIKGEIIQELTSNSHGMWMWAHCQLEEVSQRRSVKDVREALRCLPQSLDDTYRRILEKIHPSERKWAIRALSWLCGARSPMTLGMLEEAIAINFENFEVDEDDRLFSSEYILEILGSLVKVRHNEKFPQVMVIELAHFSVQQYLEKPGELEFHFPPSMVELRLAKACLAYSTSKTFDSGLQKLDPDPDQDKDSKEDLWMFLHYCTTFLFDHLCGPGVEATAFTFAYQRFGDPDRLSQYYTRAKLASGQEFSMPRRMYVHYVDAKVDTNTIDNAFWTPICFLVAAGQRAHVEKLMGQSRAVFEESYSSDITDIETLLGPVMQPLGSALIISVMAEKAVITDCLLSELMWFINLPQAKRGWSSYAGKLLRTLLNLSASQGAKILMVKLMEVLKQYSSFTKKEAEIILQETIHCAAQAAKTGSIGCVSYILESGFQPRIRTASFKSNRILHSRMEYSPDLMRIAHVDWLAFCDPQILLEISDGGETVFETRLHQEKDNIIVTAVGAGNYEIAFMLANSGLGILSAAVHLEPTFWAICRYASPLNSVEPFSGNPYFKFLARFLSRHPADNERARTELNHALVECCLGSNAIEVVRLLLRHGADPNACIDAKLKVESGMSNTCGTALIAASMMQGLPVVEELLGAGANVNLESTSGRLRTPLIAAASTTRIKSYKVLELLMHKGANVKSIVTRAIGLPSFDTSYHGSQPGSPLLAAIQNDGRIFDKPAVKIIVEMLLDAGADEDINRFVEGDDFGTPLIAAAALGLPDIVDLLLEKGASCDTVGHQDTDWRLPSLAAIYGEEPGLALKLLEIEDYASLTTEANAWGKCFVYVCSQGESEESSDSDWNRLSAALLSHGVDVTFQMAGGVRLRMNGSLVDEASYYGSAIIAACVSGQSSLFTALIAKGASEYPSSAGHYGTCLAAASKSGSSELVKFLLDRSLDHDPNLTTPSVMNWCPLVAAAATSGRQGGEAVKLLLDKGVDPNMQYRWANPALTTQDILEPVFQRSKTWHHAFMLARMWEMNTITGPSLASSFPFFGSPLVAAAAERNEEPMVTLIQNGADPGRTVDFGFYPSAMIASYDLKKRSIIADELSDAGVATLTATEVLKYIRSFGFVTSEHFQEHPRLTIEGSFWGNMLTIAVKSGLAIPFLLGQDVNPNEAVPGSFYGTAMIAASALLESAGVALFLEKGAPVDSQTCHGAFGTPLIAVCAGPPDFLYNVAFDSDRKLVDHEYWEHTQIDLLEQFLDLGARPNVQHRGISPLIALICCTSSKRQHGVELLLRHGADPYLEIPRYEYQTPEGDDGNKWSAIQVARERGDAALVELMKKHRTAGDES
ncbi:hypothetical protein BGZ57DRAFT_957703 [Hyaloscypha finlandica]|nr:hypothetical protein BGZ57DRAFT_957703 [Hyaloscypha finlandica]